MPIYHVQVKSENLKLVDTLKKIVKQTNEKGRGMVSATYKEFAKDKHQLSFRYDNVAGWMFKKIVFKEIKKGINKKFPKAKVVLVGNKSIKEKIKGKLKGN